MGELTCHDLRCSYLSVVGVPCDEGCVDLQAIVVGSNVFKGYVALRPDPCQNIIANVRVSIAVKLKLLPIYFEGHISEHLQQLWRKRQKTYS